LRSTEVQSADGVLIDYFGSLPLLVRLFSTSCSSQNYNGEKDRACLHMGRQLRNGLLRYTIPPNGCTVVLSFFSVFNYG
jgi:hypothetical protein